jgi:hypothetical protein
LSTSPKIATISASALDTAIVTISSLFSQGECLLDGVPRSLDALDEAVLAWMKTSAAWDRRKHPTILQFLRDIRLYTTAICATGNVSPTILNLELDRLRKKVSCPVIDEKIDDLRRDISNLQRVEQVEAGNTGV